jgi:hypothetical protein
MKVIVLYENSTEQALASNLVAVLRKIGAMLVYGKVNDAGVLLEDWQSKPKVKLECIEAQSPSMPAVRGDYSYEMPYVDGIGYAAPGYAMSPPGTLSVTRELMRDLVRMFPKDGDRPLDTLEAKKRKPVVPKPNTTQTGVTVRQLDIWEDDTNHEE